MKTIIAIVVAIAILFEHYVQNATMLAQSVIIPVLAKFLSGRKVIMVYDSDGSKPDKIGRFQSCVRDLAGALSEISAKLRTVFIPGSSNGEKQGLDDYLLTHSKEQFWELVKNGASKVAPSAGKWAQSERSFTTTDTDGNCVDMASLAAREGKPFWVDGNANRPTKATVNQSFMARLYGIVRRVVFESAENSFYEYDSSRGLWVHKTDAAVTYDLSQETRTLAKEYFNDSPEAVELVAKSSTHSCMASATAYARGIHEMPGIFSNKRRRGVIHVKNTMLILSPDKGIEKVDFSHGFYSRNQVPVAFDINATCPEFMALLEGPLDQDDISLLQRWFGTVLLGGNPGQAIMILVGTAGGGKGTVCEVLENILGRENVTELRTEHMTRPFELAGYAWKTLLTGKDVPGDFLELKGASAMKKLVGHDWLTAEAKHANERTEFRGESSIMITSNERLRLRLGGGDDSEAWRRRLNIISFTRPPPLLQTRRRLRHPPSGERGCRDIELGCRRSSRLFARHRGARLETPADLRTGEARRRPPAGEPGDGSLRRGTSRG